jgi:integrase
VPDELIFGPEPGRVAPHIYHQEEIVELLAAARKLGPRGSLRPATYEALFGLMASSGLRVSEAIHLRDADVDLKRGMLTVRQTKFAKSRQLPMHPSTVEAMARYRRERVQQVPSTPDTPFLVSSRGRRLGTVRLTASSLRYVTVSVGSIAARTMRRDCTTCAIPLPSDA